MMISLTHVTRVGGCGLPVSDSSPCRGDQQNRVNDIFQSIFFFVMTFMGKWMDGWMNGIHCYKHRDMLASGGSSLVLLVKMFQSPPALPGYLEG